MMSRYFTLSEKGILFLTPFLHPLYDDFCSMLCIFQATKPLTKPTLITIVVIIAIIILCHIITILFLRISSSYWCMDFEKKLKATNMFMNFTKAITLLCNALDSSLFKSSRVWSQTSLSDMHMPSVKRLIFNAVPLMWLSISFYDIFYINNEKLIGQYKLYKVILF